MLLARINEAFIRLKDSAVEQWKALRAIVKHAEKCIEVDGNFFENLLQFYWTGLE